MLNLFVVFSIIENKEATEKRLSSLVDEIIKEENRITFRGYFNSIEDLVKDKSEIGDYECSNIILNASGGTESLIKFIVENSKQPTLILANSQKNSFASSLESYAYLKDNYPVNISYSDISRELISKVNKFACAADALTKINSSHFLGIGSPSDWLLTSQDFSGFGNFKTKFTRMDVEELVSEVQKVTDESTKEITDNWKSSFNEILVNEKSLLDSAKVYLALKQIVENENVNVLTVRCFDLLKNNYTACMGLSICNDEGITAGCEGDLPTTFTMLIAQQLRGQSVWMANPSSIDKVNNQIIFAHCSVPQSFLASVKESGLTTHMESGLSTAIRGPIKRTEVTIMRIDKDFKKITAVKGKITESDMKDANLCRTQAVIEIESSVEKWIEETFGNHHVIIYGDILPELKYFCSFANVELIEL